MNIKCIDENNLFSFKAMPYYLKIHILNYIKNIY